MRENPIGRVAAAPAGGESEVAGYRNRRVLCVAGNTIGDWWPAEQRAAPSRRT